MGVGQVLLDLLPLVEYGAVPVGTQDILVEGALATLALRPQLGEHPFMARHLQGFLRVDLSLPRRAVHAKRRLLRLGNGGLAAQAFELLDCKHHDAPRLGRWGRTGDRTRVVSGKEAFCGR